MAVETIAKNQLQKIFIVQSNKMDPQQPRVYGKTGVAETFDRAG